MLFSLSLYNDDVCRLCLGTWTDHGERTGGFYACNRYETAKQEGAVCNFYLSAQNSEHIIVVLISTQFQKL